jgi:hypothetical protein
MQHKLIQSVGVAWTLLYAVFVIWIYATEPRTLREVASGAQVVAGTYEVDREKFEEGLRLFRAEQFRAARDEWTRADPEQRDARTQFYIAYAFYREGWGRVYSDDALYRQGLEAANRAVNLSRDERLRVDDPDLQLHTPAELKAELEQGLERTASDLNPLKVFRQRK